MSESANPGEHLSGTRHHCGRVPPVSLGCHLRPSRCHITLTRDRSLPGTIGTSILCMSRSGRKTRLPPVLFRADPVHPLARREIDLGRIPSVCLRGNLGVVAQQVVDARDHLVSRTYGTPKTRLHPVAYPGSPIVPFFAAPQERVIGTGCHLARVSVHQGSGYLGVRLRERT